METSDVLNRRDPRRSWALGLLCRAFFMLVHEAERVAEHEHGPLLGREMLQRGHEGQLRRRLRTR